MELLPGCGPPHFTFVLGFLLKGFGSIRSTASGPLLYTDFLHLYTLTHTQLPPASLSLLL